MSMFREQLVLKALAALSEIADECGDQPAQRSLSLRFLLAYTFVASGSDPRNKRIWIEFWKHATSPRSGASHEKTMADYIRGTGARSALNGICREIGYPTDVEFLQMLRKQRERGSSPTEPVRALPVASNDEPTDNDAA
jgi:hypothetical protein